MWSRIHTRISLAESTPGDTAEYLHHRLRIAGCDREVFNSDAIALIHEHSQGRLRDTDRIATDALRISVGVEPGASGPSIVRDLSPWPTICKGRPGSRLAAPHAGHRAGRTASQDGGFLAQDLTSTSQWTIRCALRGSVSNVSAEHGGTRCSIHRPRHSIFAGPVPVLRLQPPLYDGLGAARDKPASPMSLNPRTPSSPSPSSRQTALARIIHPAR